MANITGSKAVLQSVPLRPRDSVYVLQCLYECDHSSVCACAVRNSQHMCFAVVCGGHCIVIPYRSAQKELLQRAIWQTFFLVSNRRTLHSQCSLRCISH